MRHGSSQLGKDKFDSFPEDKKKNTSQVVSLTYYQVFVITGRLGRD